MDARARRRGLALGGLLLLAGCTGQPTASQLPAPTTTLGPAPGQAGAVGSSCRVTRPSTARPPDGGADSWYRGDDGAIWAIKLQLFAGDNKLGWMKPTGPGRLRVGGRRLDGPAPPLVAHLPGGYAGPFQASGLDIPTAGCWQVEASLGTSTLRFVTLVLPRMYRAPEASCPDLAATVRQADGVVVGTVEGIVADRPGFSWATVRVERALAARPRGLPAGERVDLLVGRGTLAVQPRVGDRYLLVVAADPGLAPQVLCGALATVVDDRVVASTGGLLRPWAGRTVAAVERAVGAAQDQALLGEPTGNGSARPRSNRL